MVGPPCLESGLEEVRSDHGQFESSGDSHSRPKKFGRASATVVRVGMDDCECSTQFLEGVRGLFLKEIRVRENVVQLVELDDDDAKPSQNLEIDIREDRPFRSLDIDLKNQVLARVGFSCRNPLGERESGFVTSHAQPLFCEGVHALNERRGEFFEVAAEIEKMGANPVLMG